MEIIINDSTFILKKMNVERRNVFVNNILRFFDPNSTFEEFISKTQEILKEKYKFEFSKRKTTILFFKEFGKSINETIWHFLKDNDKNMLKTVNDIDIKKDEMVKFVEFFSQKIKEYNEICSSNSSDQKSEDIFSIYTYAAKNLGWSLEEIDEMCVVDLFKILEKLIEINQRENASELNNLALAGAFAQGSKEAKSAIDKINREVIDKNNNKVIESGNILESNLSIDELKKIMGVV